MNFVRSYLLLAATTLTFATYPRITEVSTEDGFQKEVVNKERVVVKLYANWCPACRKFATVFNKVASSGSFENKVNFVSINYDNIESIATFKDLIHKESIRTIPTLIYFKQGSALSDEIDFDAYTRTEAEVKLNINRVFDLE